MIHESNSFVSLSLQRKLQPVAVPNTINEAPLSNEQTDEKTLKNVTNQLNNNNLTNLKEEQQQIEANNLADYESKLISELSESCREDNENQQQQKTFYVEEANEETSESNESLNKNSKITHRKQYSMTDELLDQPVNHDDPAQQAKIKKTLSSTNTKSYQTKSLSSIVSKPSMVHSTSDNELDQKSKRFTARNTLNEADLFFPYKDDLAPSDSQTAPDDSSEKQFDLSLFTTYSQLVLKPINVAIFLNYLLSTATDSPKNLYFCLFTDDLLSSNEKKETLLRWSYEIYSTFLMPNAPLKIKTNESVIYKLDELYEKNSTDVVPQLKKLFDEVRTEVIDNVNMQLTRLREVSQLGLVNLFQGGLISEISRSKDTDQVKLYLANLFSNYLNELNKTIDLNRISNDWNDSRVQESQTSALICSFATYLKRYSIPVKQIAKFDCDKIPVFVNRKNKPKKQVINQRGHNLVDYLCANTKTVCAKCKLPFWGIGNQALVCQKSKCELKFHRNCVNAYTLDCMGSQKTTRAEYKEKLDSFQKILFGSKKKEDDTSSTTSSFFLTSFGSTDSQLGQKKEFDRQPSMISNKYDADNHNLPVNLAIKRFEDLTRPVSVASQPVPINAPKMRLSENQSIDQQQADLLLNKSLSPTGDNNFSNYYMLAKSSTNQQLQSFSPSSNTTNIKNLKIIKRNSNLKGKECKRVGSLKTDMKKVKTNVTRSKSDPHPDEIKNAITTTTTTSDLQPKATPSPPPLTQAQPQQQPPPPNTNRYSVDLSSTLDANESLMSQISSPNKFDKPTSSLRVTSFSSNSRSSWMNDSDMEVDEELPNLSVHIERDRFDKLTKKEIKVQEVINELIHTEQKHVRNLKIMKHHFFVPIRVEVLLSEEERNLLFPNLDEILELHSVFNNKLKKLRKENPIVPIEQLIDVIQEQFEGETGNRFQNACATFCQNQSEAMKFLQAKSRLAADKFTSFLLKSENDLICRKLHLKDFLPTEVQRLVKYRLLFQELTKNTADEVSKRRLTECMDASSKISLFVNKAVTECENRKRVVEIQNKLDTKEFDQYCVRSPVLSPYRSLQLTARKLIYEGELEWKLSNIKLTALLFEDILVFLEMLKTDTSNDEKKKYILRPLIYIIGKTKQMFTPVIPLSCINSFRSMHDKRSFHLVAIIEDSSKLTKHSTMLSSKPIQAQMLFILIAKSGDERNKWTQHLQELTGKMMQSVGHELHNSNVQDLTKSSTNSLTNTTSATNLLSNTSQSTIRNNSISTSALLNPTKLEFSTSIDKSNEAQLNKINSDIIQLLKTRHELLARIIKLNSSDSVSTTSEFSTSESDAPKDWVTNSISLVNALSASLFSDTISFNSSSLSQQDKSVQLLIKLEDYLNKIYRHIVLPKIDEKLDLNTSLSSTTTTSATTTLTTPAPTPVSNITNSSITTTSTNSNKMELDDGKYTKKQPPIGTSLNVKENDSVADAVSTTTTSELTADLSEDEQINYYDDYDYNSSTDNLNENESGKYDLSSTTSLSNRRFSDSSNKTLCLLTPGANKIYQTNSITTTHSSTSNASSTRKHLNLDADDEDEMYSKKNANKMYTNNNDVNSNDEDTNEKYSKKTNSLNLDTKPIKLTCSQSSSDLNDKLKSSVTLKYSETFDSESRKSFRPSTELLKSMGSIESKSSQSPTKSPSEFKYSMNSNNNNNNSNNEDLNDSSADEVKDYLTLRDSFDEISHV